MGIWIEAIVSSGVGALVSGGIILAAKAWISTRIEESIKHEYGIALEELREDIAKTQAAQAAAVGAFTAAHAATHVRKIQAVEKLWNTMFALWADGPMGPTMTLNFTPAEERSILNNREIMTMIQRDTRAQVVETLRSAQSIESERPFLTGELWTAFTIYRTIWARQCTRFLDARDSGTFTPWREDTPMKNFIELLLGKEKVATIYSSQLGFAEAKGAVESHILQLADDVLSGRASGTAGLKQAVEARHLMEQSPNSAEVQARAG